MAWDLLTNVYRIDPQRLFVTVFGGDEKIRAESDLETYNIWREIGYLLQFDSFNAIDNLLLKSD